MKKQECAIVEDLLVLYEDDVLQPESKAMIEAHIKECESCRNLYREVGKKIRLEETERWKTEKSQDDEAVLVMKKVRNAIRKRWIRVVCIVMAVTIIGVCAANKVADRMTGHFGGVLEWARLLPTEKIEVAKLYRLKNGDIYCTLRAQEELWGITTGDWMLEESERLKSTDRATQEISLRTNAMESFRPGVGGSRKTVTLIFVTERTGNVSATGETITQRCREISLRGKTPKDRMVLWKAGQKAEEAPEQIEEEAARAYELEDRMPQEEDEVKFEKSYSTVVMF